MSDVVVAPEAGAEPVAAAPVTPANPAVEALTPAAAPVGADWFAGLSDDLRAQEPIKRFEGKGLDDFAKGFLEQQKMARSGIPHPGDTPEAFAKFADALRPADASAYKIDVPEGADPGYAEHMRGEFHKIGLPPQFAEAVVAANNGYAASLEKASSDALDAFKAGYQGNYDADLGLAKSALAMLDPDGSKLAELGTKATSVDLVKWAIDLGRKVGPLAGAGGDVTPGMGHYMALSPKDADAKLNELQGNAEWRGKARQPGSRESNERKALIQAAARPDPAQRA
jgi:hypothetical protein